MARLLCYLDGNELCIINSDFENLQESEGFFIGLTPNEIEMIRIMEQREEELSEKNGIK